MRRSLSKNRSKNKSQVQPLSGKDVPESGEVLEGEVLPAEPASDPVDASIDEEPELLEVEPGQFSADEEPVESEDDTPSAALVRYNPLDAYLAEIRKFAPLSKEDEYEAAVDYVNTKSPDAAYKLVSGSLWLVVKIARDYERVAKNVLDLIQEGNIGLMEAVRNFDPYRGVRFPSYAVWWIRAYIIRYIIANWRMVKIGTTQAQRKLFFNLKKESDRLEKEGIYPSTRLLAERLNVKEGEVIEMSQRLGGGDVSVDAPLKDDTDTNLLSVLPSDKESAEDHVAKKQLRVALEATIGEFEASLSDKDKAIFHGRIMDDEKKTLQELSDLLGISKERVRQIENKLRDKLKEHVSKQLGAELDQWID